jgi:heme exporter protein A
MMLEARDLACWRGERLVFRGLSIALGPGDALILSGPNGSGKSSLLRLMAGLTPPYAGAILWDGVGIAEDPAAHRGRLHFIGHQDAVKPVLTVAEAIAFWGGLRGGDGAMTALAHFGLDRLAETPCRLLSAGQKKRLSLARLLASPAPLWLLDEPTTGLDAQSTGALEAAIAGHREAGGIVVAATHVPLLLAGVRELSLADHAPAPDDDAAAWPADA